MGPCVAVVPLGMPALDIEVPGPSPSYILISAHTVEGSKFKLEYLDHRHHMGKNTVSMAIPEHCKYKFMSHFEDLFKKNRKYFSNN